MGGVLGGTRIGLGNEVAGEVRETAKAYDRSKRTSNIEVVVRGRGGTVATVIDVVIRYRRLGKQASKGSELG